MNELQLLCQFFNRAEIHHVDPFLNPHLHANENKKKLNDARIEYEDRNANQYEYDDEFRSRPYY